MPLAILAFFALTLLVAGFIIFRQVMRYSKTREIFNINEVETNSRSIIRDIGRDKLRLAKREKALEAERITRNEELKQIKRYDNE